MVHYQRIPIESTVPNVNLMFAYHNNEISTAERILLDLPEVKNPL